MFTERLGHRTVFIFFLCTLTKSSPPYASSLPPVLLRLPGLLRPPAEALLGLLLLKLWRQRNALSEEEALFL